MWYLIIHALNSSHLFKSIKSKTLRDGMGREVGTGWGTHVYSMADSCQHMAKTTTI